MCVHAAEPRVGLVALVQLEPLRRHLRLGLELRLGRRRRVHLALLVVGQLRVEDVVAARQQPARLVGQRQLLFLAVVEAHQVAAVGLRAALRLDRHELEDGPLHVARRSRLEDSYAPPAQRLVVRLHRLRPARRALARLLLLGGAAARAPRRVVVLLLLAAERLPPLAVAAAALARRLVGHRLALGLLLPEPLLPLGLDLEVLLGDEFGVGRRRLDRRRVAAQQALAPPVVDGQLVRARLVLRRAHVPVARHRRARDEQLDASGGAAFELVVRRHKPRQLVNGRIHFVVPVHLNVDGVVGQHEVTDALAAVELDGVLLRRRREVDDARADEAPLAHEAARLGADQALVEAQVWHQQRLVAHVEAHRPVAAREALPGPARLDCRAEQLRLLRIAVHRELPLQRWAGLAQPALASRLALVERLPIDLGLGATPVLALVLPGEPVLKLFRLRLMDDALEVAVDEHGLHSGGYPPCRAAPELHLHFEPLTFVRPLPASWRRRWRAVWSRRGGRRGRCCRCRCLGGNLLGARFGSLQR